MNHSLINPNQIRFNGLDFFDNMIRDDELYIEMNDELNIPVQFKGTKCIFLSLVPTHAELEMCQHFYMKSNNKWNPDSVNLRELRKISQQYKNDTRNIYQTKRDTVYTYPIPKSKHVHDTYSYHDPSSEKSILLEIFSSFIQLKELCVGQINVREHSNEKFPAHRTFVSRKRHADLPAGSLAELWHIGPKCAKATMTATTKNGIRSAIMFLRRRYRYD